MNVIQSALNTRSQEFADNREAMQAQVQDLRDGEVLGHFASARYRAARSSSSASAAVLNRFVVLPCSK